MLLGDTHAKLPLHEQAEVLAGLTPVLNLRVVQLMQVVPEGTATAGLQIQVGVVPVGIINILMHMHEPTLVSAFQFHCNPVGHLQLVALLTPVE